MAASSPLTATDIYRYFQCPHWPYWERFGDAKDRRPLTLVEEDRLAEGLEHEQEVVKQLFPGLQEIVDEHPEHGFQKTVELMREGAAAIYHGWLVHEDWVGRPDVLEKRAGQSAFGDWYYAPIDIKRAHELRKEHKAQLMFYAVMLERIQKRFPTQPQVINKDAERLSFNAEEYSAEFQTIIEALERIRGGEMPEPVYRKSCEDVSPWGAACRRLAEERHDIALLFNVELKKLQALREQGIRMIEDAAELDPAILAGVHPVLTLKALQAVQRQARSLLEKVVMVRKPFVDPTRGLEIHFDIESYPPTDTDYLYGFWIREGKEERYLAFTAETPEQEEKLWRSFMKWIETLPDEMTIYHFSNYEYLRPLILAKRYGDEGYPHLARFLARTVDLNEVIRDHVVFPLYFYSLKAINKFLGFSWEGDVQGGGESVNAYDRWRKTGDRAIWESLLTYNKSDVRATAFLLDWLRTHAKEETVYHKEQL
jgi:predicted RecB family nuclease